MVNKKIMTFCKELINAQKATLVAPTSEEKENFWFGSGGAVEYNGSLYLFGRYRDFNKADKMGEKWRGWRLSIFKSEDKGKTWKESSAFIKKDLVVDGHKVNSIEGSALYVTNDGVKLLASMHYDDIKGPNGLPNGPAWAVVEISGESFESLDISTIKLITHGWDSEEYRDIKDPSFYQSEKNGNKIVLRAHPYNNSAGLTSYYDLDENFNKSSEVYQDVLKRGVIWDTLFNCASSVIDLEEGEFKNKNVQIVFYDGCGTYVDENGKAHAWSCNEKTSFGVMENFDWNTFERAGVRGHLFESPKTTGCLRYIHVLKTTDGYYSTFQMAGNAAEQSLYIHFLPQSRVDEIFA